jgi:anti-anti-sigma factor
MQIIEPKVELKRFKGGIVLTLKDATISGYRQVESLKREILQILEENEQAQRVVLDFANVRFFATPFFSLIIKIRQKAGQLELCNLDPNVREALEVTNLTKIFPVCKDPLRDNA